MITRLLIFVLTFFALPLAAQRRGIVCEMESRVPVAKAIIYTKDGKQHLTDTSGRFSLPAKFGSATVSHSLFLSRVIDETDRTDTIFLIRKQYQLDEVVVTAQGLKLDPQISKSIMRSAKEGAMRNPSGISCDMLGWLRLFEKGHVSRKEREKRKKAIENY